MYINPALTVPDDINRVQKFIVDNQGTPQGSLISNLYYACYEMRSTDCAIFLEEILDRGLQPHYPFVDECRLLWFECKCHRQLQLSHHCLKFLIHNYLDEFAKGN